MRGVDPGSKIASAIRKIADDLDTVRVSEDTVRVSEAEAATPLDPS